MLEIAAFVYTFSKVVPFLLVMVLLAPVIYEIIKSRGK